MAAFCLQITSLVFLTSDFPRHAASARYGDLIASVGGWTIRRIGQPWEPSAEFSLFEIEHGVFTERYVLSKKVVEIIRAQRIEGTTSEAQSTCQDQERECVSNPSRSSPGGRRRRRRRRWRRWTVDSGLSRCWSYWRNGSCTGA